MLKERHYCLETVTRKICVCSGQMRLLKVWDLRLKEPVNPEATGWRCPSILHFGGQNGVLVGHEADWQARLGKSQRKAFETRVDVGALQKQAWRQAAERGTPGSHIQEKVLHPGDSSDCGPPNVKASASSFEMPSFLNKGQKGTTSRLPESPRAPSYPKFPSPRKQRWVV